MSTEQSWRPLHNRVAAIRGYRRPLEASKVSREILRNASPRIRTLLMNEIASRASRNGPPSTTSAGSTESSQLAGVQAEHVNCPGFSFPARGPSESISSGATTYEDRNNASMASLAMGSHGDAIAQTGPDPGKHCTYSCFKCRLTGLADQLRRTYFCWGTRTVWPFKLHKLARYECLQLEINITVPGAFFSNLECQSRSVHHSRETSSSNYSTSARGNGWCHSSIER